MAQGNEAPKGGGTIEGEVKTITEQGVGFIEIRKGKGKEVVSFHANGLTNAAMNEITVGTRVLVDKAGIEVGQKSGVTKGYRRAHIVTVPELDA